MKRILPIFFALIFLLPSCSFEQNFQSAGAIEKHVIENQELFTQCFSILSQMKKDRFYVAMEIEKDEEGNEIEGTLRLVTYEKESDDREEIENEILENVLLDFDLTLLYFQTASDGRRCLIFSYSKESETEKVQKGFYYSPDALPCGWWGRKADLIKKDERFLQLNRDGNAAYYTVKITENFYYFEKYGNLLA